MQTDSDQPVLQQVAERIEQRSELSKQTFQKGREMAYLPD